MLQSDPNEIHVQASEKESNFSALQVAIFLSPKCRSAPNDPEEKHVQASEEDQFLPNKGSYRNNSSPASFCIRPACSLCLGDGRYAKVPETAYATVRAR